MPLIETIIGAGLGGLLNYFSGQEQRNSQNAYINKAMELLKDSRYSARDIAIGKSDINRQYGVGVSSLANKTALSTGGVLNAPVIAAATVAPYAAQSLAAQTRYDLATTEYNKQIDSKIATLELGRPTDNSVGDILGGMIQGGIAGSQVGKLLEKSPKPKPDLKLDLNTNPDIAFEATASGVKPSTISSNVPVIKHNSLLSIDPLLDNTWLSNINIPEIKTEYSPITVTPSSFDLSLSPSSISSKIPATISPLDKSFQELLPNFLKETTIKDAFEEIKSLFRKDIHEPYDPNKEFNMDNNILNNIYRIL